MTELTDEPDNFPGKPDFKLPHYVVRWEIDIWADTPREAAIEAREIMKSDGIATTVFTVEHYHLHHQVDLEEVEEVPPEPEPWVSPDSCAECGMPPGHSRHNPAAAPPPYYHAHRQ